MADTRMTFTLQGRDNLSQAFRQAGLSAGRLRKDLAAVGASAALPAAAAGAAAVASLAAAVGAAGVAVAAFGAAVAPQAKQIGEVSKAHQKYAEAVAESGVTSQQAAQAQLAYSKAAAKLPAATRESAAAFLVLKDSYRQWSDSLAGDTMPVVTKSFMTFSALLPKLTPLVKGASGEFDRLISVIAGGVASGSFDALTSKFTNFTERVLDRGTDQMIHFARAAQGFDPGGGPLGDFLDYARRAGPLAAETLRSIALAAGNLAQAAGPLGMTTLQLVNALAKLVAAIPPDALGTVLQLYLAFRLLSTAAAALGVLHGVVRTLGVRLMAMSVAASGATGAMAGLRAAWLALGRVARGTIVVAAVAALVVGLNKLGNLGRSAPPDIDKLASSLAKLGASGRVTGEAARLFGADLDGLHERLRAVTDPSQVDTYQRAFVKLGTLGFKESTPFKEAQEKLDGIDKALASLVQGGKADLAAAALQKLTAEYTKGGRPVTQLTKHLGDYKSAVEDAKFEQQLIAESMGLFGTQAQAVSAKLEQQKASADALRQAIIALNDVQRAGLGAMNSFEQSIDDAAKAAKENAGALDMVDGALDLNSQKARNAESALRDLAAKTDEAAAATYQSTQSWDKANAVYARGREKLIAAAQQMGLTRGEAAKLASQILKTPDKTARLQGNMEDLQRKLDSAKAQLGKVPDSRKAQVRAEIAQLEQKIARAKGLIASVKGKTVDLNINNHVRTYNYGAIAAGTARGGLAAGGLVPGYAAGGAMQAYPMGGLIRGPGGPTADRILTLFASGAVARTSNREYVINAAAVAKYGVALFDDLNAMRLAGGGPVGYATGGAVRKEVAGDLTGLLKALLKGPDAIRSAMKELSADLRKLGKTGAKWAGRVDKNSAKLVELSKKSQALADRIKEAKEFASGVAATARGTAAFGSLGITGPPTAANIKSGLQGKLARIKAFTALIKKLAGRGLTKGMLRQLMEMGPEDGYACALALSEANGKTLGDINALDRAIGASASALGKTSADLLYDAGKNAGKGFLTGLISQQKAIEKLMLSIAKGMQKAIRKALGIKSPSTVMAGLGVQTTRGLALGLVDGMPHLDRALLRVSDRVATTRPALIPAARPRHGGGTALLERQPVTVETKTGDTYNQTFNNAYTVHTRELTPSQFLHLQSQVETRMRYRRPR